MIVVVFPGVTGLAEKLTVVPAGLPAAVKLMGLLNPEVDVVTKLALALALPPVRDTGATELKPNVPDTA